MKSSTTDISQYPNSAIAGTLPDLDNPHQIAILIQDFYTKVAEDDLLAPIFSDLAAVDWSEHKEKLAAFWCKIALGIPGYKGSPTNKHSALSVITPFTTEHFGRWVQLFHNTIENGWQGPYAESIKARSVMMAKAQSRKVLNAEPWK